jgi:hypothetical protein
LGLEFEHSWYSSFGFDLKFAMNHVRFMISPELYVVQETLAFGVFGGKVKAHVID